MSGGVMGLQCALPQDVVVGSTSICRGGCRPHSKALPNSAFLSQGLRFRSSVGVRQLRHAASAGTRVQASLGEASSRVGELMYMLADSVSDTADALGSAASSAADSAISVADAVTSAVPAVVEAAPKDDGFFGFFSGTLETILKLLEGGLSGLHVPYAYGFSIILLTLLVKAATYPLTKQQVESTLAMQNLQPKLKGIQDRYKGNAERIQLETARIYKQAGVNPLAGCLPTLATLPVWIGLYRALTNVADEGLLTEGFFFIPSLAGPTANFEGLSWLFPFVDGHPPIGWGQAAIYLILPIVLVISQFFSMKIMSPPQSDDPSVQQSQAILKFLPWMIGYFSLSVPSGLSLYWLTNNVLTTAQQVYLRKMGGATPAVGDVEVMEIIDAGKARRTGPAVGSEGAEAAVPRGERFRQLKAQEAAKKGPTRAATPAGSEASSHADAEWDSDSEETEVPSESGASRALTPTPSRSSKRSKRTKRA